MRFRRGEMRIRAARHCFNMIPQEDGCLYLWAVEHGVFLHLLLSAFLNQLLNSSLRVDDSVFVVQFTEPGFLAASILPELCRESGEERILGTLAAQEFADDFIFET